MSHNPRKRFGQNFLVDNQIINKIISTINPKNNEIIVEIGPGKVLSGLIKRINKEVKINTINNEVDIKSLKI